ncbi:MAG: hypothetical protein M3Q95_00730, partial [Bacteroidota bacterium]|nr:hypothetical protein [Bacteroidota bacterium]
MDLMKSDFAIEIKFDKRSENPSRIFKTMSNLIEDLQSFDKKLVQNIDSKLEPTFLLEDIEISSLRVWLANVLRSVDDEGI